MDIASSYGEYDAISISDEEGDDIALSEIAPNPAIQDFIVLDDDEPTIPTAHQRPRRQPTTTPRRNAQPQLPEVFIDTCKLIGEKVQNLGPTASTLKIGDTVELHLTQQPGQLHDGDFLRVHKIIENLRTGAITLRGLLFRRNKYLSPMLPRKMNEVHIVVTMDADDPRPYQVQGLEEVPLICAMRKRRLVVTDRPYPMSSYRDEVQFDSSGLNANRICRDICANELLACRNIFVTIYEEGERKCKRNKPYQGILRFILPQEADNNGGLLTGKHEEHVDLTGDIEDPEPGYSTRRPHKMRQYTFVDGFSGAGGASCAAKLAGLLVKCGFDHNPVAVVSASTNFPRARIFECEAVDFPPPGYDAHADIIHFSPPCQSFSPVNTRPNARNDELNTNALLAIGRIIRVVKPRLVTLEETFGLLTRAKHEQWFQMLLSLIHDEGYSVRWAIQHGLNYRITQPRQRLILIAAAPGVPLPEMPKPTNGPPGSGLLPYVTVREAIGNLPRGVTHHNPELAKRVAKPAWDPDMPYTKTILTSNSDVYHWSGQRAFTNRELAGIQGFPHWMSFFGSHSDVERQIGNAVPPVWFKLVLDECVKVLRKLDRQENRRSNPEHDTDERGDIVILDEEAARAKPEFGNAARRRVLSRILSPAPPSSSQRSGTSSDDAIIVDDDKNEILID